MTDTPTYEEFEAKVNHIKNLESELEQARKALHQSQYRIKALLEGSHDAIVITTRGGQFVDCNHRALEVYALESKGSFRSRRPADFSPPFQPDGKKSSDAAKELIEKAFEDGILHFQWVHRRDNGEEFPAEVILAAIRFGDQEALQASVRDITGRKRAEEALHRKTVYLEALNETALGLMHRMDLNDLFQDIVVRAMKLSGADEGWLCVYEPESDDVEFKVVLGPNARLAGTRFDSGRGMHGEILRTHGIVLVEDYSSWPKRAEEKAYDSRRATIGIPLIYDKRFEGTLGLSYHDPLRRFDKDLVPILERLAELASIALDNNRLYARMKLELAERERAARESKRLQEQLLQAQKMESIGRLAGGVAHDFNNMLQVILGHVEVGLGLGPASEPLQKDLLEIRKAAERSADLTRQLLAFARKQPAAPRILDLNDTVSGMLKMLRRLIGEDIHLIWKPGADLWPVRIDPIQVDQILANLSVNARDAIKGVGSLTIETRNVFLDQADLTSGAATGEYVLLSISDTGSGMDKETLDHVFEPFFTTKDIGKGTGLGLATVYGIVTQNEGLANVTSGPGEGTRIDIYLPRVQTEAASELEEKDREPEPGSETVLLVEDEEMILSLGEAILERFGYKVLACRNPDEALKIAADYEGPIHLLLTDVVMPQMNGRDLKNRIEAARPGIKFVFMSGYTADVIANRGVIEEGVYFLQKPFTVRSLALKVRDVLDK